MRHFIIAVIYTAIASTAIASDLMDLRTGDMRKLRIHETVKAGSDVPFMGADGTERTLADHSGKFVVLNFWATWCAPCRKEMPHLSALQTDMGDDTFEVVTIATGRNEPVAMQAFFGEIGVDNLPLYRDPRQKLARDLGVFGLPVTLILDTSGQEIARLQGEADWSSDNAKTLIKAIMETY